MQPYRADRALALSLFRHDWVHSLASHTLSKAQKSGPATPHTLTQSDCWQPAVRAYPIILNPHRSVPGFLKFKSQAFKISKPLMCASL